MNLRSSTLTSTSASFTCSANIVFRNLLRVRRRFSRINPREGYIFATWSASDFFLRRDGEHLPFIG